MAYIPIVTQNILHQAAPPGYNLMQFLVYLVQLQHCTAVSYAYGETVAMES